MNVSGVNQITPSCKAVLAALGHAAVYALSIFGREGDLDGITARTMAAKVTLTPLKTAATGTAAKWRAKRYFEKRYDYLPVRDRQEI
jgi:hypothetical protein